MSLTESWVKNRIEIEWVHGLQFQGNAPLQEDCFQINPERGIFILADGFGGSPGADAAKLVIEAMKQFLEQEAGDLDATLPFELRPYYSLAGNVLFNAVSFANQKLMAFNKKTSWMDAGGASVIAGYLEGRLLSIANVGACSAHLFRNGKSKEIIAPKTLGRQQNPFEEEVGSHSVPLMSFGTVKQLEPEITEIEIKKGDQLCFQTSGFTSKARDQIFQLQDRNSLAEQFVGQAWSANSSFIWAGF